jgi:predicted TIM-barrel fold metal-dependent hydrolase
MLIVDAQVHIWAAATPDRPWPPGRSQPHRPQPFSKDDLLAEMDAAGVARVVIVPPSWEGVTFFTEELPWLSASDQEWVMGRAVCEWLGWP